MPVFTVGYLVPITFGWGVGWGPTWGLAPALAIEGGLLRLGGIGFLVAQRQVRR